MFNRQPETLDAVIRRTLRANGLETPLVQKRLVDAWERVAGEKAAAHTTHKRIDNQTLVVGISSPALRQELSMRRTELARALNAAVGAMVITGVRFA